MPGSTADAPLTELIELTTCGRLRPLTGGEYELAQAGLALANLAACRSVGKVILRLRPASAH